MTPSSQLDSNSKRTGKTKNSMNLMKKWTKAPNSLEWYLALKKMLREGTFSLTHDYTTSLYF